PVAAPSANISGSPSPTSFIHVLQDFEGKIPCVLTGPDAMYGLESTVVDCSVSPPVVLRPGVITLEQLKRIDKRIRIASKTKTAKSPGQKYRHYAPRAKVKIITNYKYFLTSTSLTTRRVVDLPPSMRGNKAAYIGLKIIPKLLIPKFKRYYVAKDVNDYAKKLFAFFRTCDMLGVKTIYTGAVVEKGIGLAIMNRLRKAIK
ncbi:MAG TPA: Sua5 family C-terminal domain-containing protein, partial [Ignavibacteria bacterium]|nr:Sua5 family C-terminal domain-containing protein [Ignavibacteria bacterium]